MLFGPKSEAYSEQEKKVLLCGVQTLGPNSLIILLSLILLKYISESSTHNDSETLDTEEKTNYPIIQSTIENRSKK